MTETEAKTKEARKIAREQRERDLQQTALDLFDSGHMSIIIAGRRIAKIGEDASVSCPSCDAPMGSYAVLAMASVWKNAPSPLALMTSKGYNLVVCHAYPLFWSPDMKCPSCGVKSQVTVQLVL